MAYISFMIPVYNGEELIRQSIESVLNQPENDWNLIIMDDGSSDSTLEICREYEEKDERIKVISHCNTGLGKNRNLGFPYLEGSVWSIFLDHDDLLIDGFYNSSFKKFLEKCHDHEVDVIVPSRIRVDYKVSKAVVDKMDDYGLVDGGNRYSWSAKYEFASMIYSTELLMKNNIRFYETRPEMESIFRHMTIFLSRKVLYTDKVCFSVRRDNKGSISNTWNYLDIIPIRLEGYVKLLEWHNKSGNIEGIESCKKYIKIIYNEYYIESVKRNGIDTISKILKDSDFLTKNNDKIYNIIGKRESKRFRIIQKYPKLYWIARKLKILKEKSVQCARNQKKTKENRADFVALQNSIKYDDQWLKEICRTYGL